MLSLSRRTLIILTATSLSLFLLLIASSQRIGGWSALDEAYFHRGNSQPYPAPSVNAADPTYAKADHSRDCAHFPDTSNIMLVMKTGASESFARVPTQLFTVLKCLPDFLIFSDMDQSIGGYHIHDSLDTVLPEASQGNSDFDLYRRQQACIVNQEDCNKLGNPAKEGWNLDKYKNIHMAEKAWAARPGYDWYVFVDADTYVLWNNLVTWLKTLDPRKKSYLGSVTLVSGFPFGHGGSGYVVSGAAMQKFAGEHPGVGNQWDVRTKRECCGDYVFALALKDATDVGVKNVWPTINGEKPATLPFGPSHWCQPIVTMHHMNSEEINTFYDFEHDRYSPRDTNATGHGHAHADTSPLLIKDIYHRYLAPQLLDMRLDWDNRANDRYYLDRNATNHQWEDWQLDRMKDADKYNEFERHAHRSFEECAAACKSLPVEECFSYRYQPGICMVAKAFALGKPVKKDVEGGPMTSGWDVEKINRWIGEQGDCKEVKWPQAGGGGKW